MGQDKPVFVHKLVVSGTIEEKMETLKEKKRALAESLFDPNGARTLATEADPHVVRGGLIPLSREPVSKFNKNPTPRSACDISAKQREVRLTD